SSRGLESLIRVHSEPDPRVPGRPGPWHHEAPAGERPCRLLAWPGIENPAPRTDYGSLFHSALEVRCRPPERKSVPWGDGDRTPLATGDNHCTPGRRRISPPGGC